MSRADSEFMRFSLQSEVINRQSELKVEVLGGLRFGADVQELQRSLGT